MFDINASWDERGCYQKWKKLMTQHRSRNVRQQYYQERRIDAWEREYAAIEEQMRREMMFLRKQRIMREREQVAYNEQLAIAKSELNRKRRKEAKMQRAQESFEKMQSPRRSARVASK
jgi:hypothetical protein